MSGKGLVIKSTGNLFLVRTAGELTIACNMTGKYRLEGLKSTNPVVVGDWVNFELVPGEKTGRITQVLERKNYVIRKSSKLSKTHQIIAANLDRIFLVITVAWPETFPEFIDRYLMTAEAYDIPATLIINKWDLYNEKQRSMANNWKTLYEKIKYPCLEISAHSGYQMEKLREMMKNNVCLLAGNSGVGKSTIINSILPGLTIRTNNISEYHEKGKHTTTFAEMFHLPQGGYLIDTPGIKGFGLIDMENEPLFHYFPEIFKISSGCKYNNCIHVSEPGCLVLSAVEAGEISPSRYNSYLSLLAEQKNSQKYR